MELAHNLPKMFSVAYISVATFCFFSSFGWTIFINKPTQAEKEIVNAALELDETAK